ncbi:MAG: sugar phosphate isomerase/epimerase [Clostridia bacterium]|nr:sugar phosphate isomerase/epimerase [Clostridia bacterium]
MKIGASDCLFIPTVSERFSKPLNRFERLEQFAQVGFECVDMSLGDLESLTMLLQDDWKEQIWKIGEHAQKLGISVAQVHGRPFSHIIETEPKNEGQVRLIRERICEATVMLGAKWVVEHPLVCGEGLNKENEEKVFRFNADHMKELTEMAAKYGAGIAMENTWKLPHEGRLINFFGNRIEHHLRVFEAINSPDFGLCLDTGHCSAAPEDNCPAEVARAFGHRLKVLHVHDSPGAMDTHYAPCIGRVDWQAFMKALYEIGFDGAFCLEIHGAVMKLPGHLHTQALTLAKDTARWLIDEYYR